MDAGYSVIALNPLETHEQKRRSVRKVKTDKVDSNRIAKLYYLDDRAPLRPVNPDIAELRNLCRLYDGLTNVYTEIQLRFQSILEQLFPLYLNVFSKVCGDSSLRVIGAFPTPEAILSAGREDIIHLLDRLALLCLFKRAKNFFKKLLTFTSWFRRCTAIRPSSLTRIIVRVIMFLY